MHGASFLNRALPHCNHRSGHLKTEHTESLFLLRRDLVNWPRSPAVSTSERTAGSAWETWTVAAANGVRFAREKWETNFLLTFETAPFICKHTVLLTHSNTNHKTLLVISSWFYPSWCSDTFQVDMAHKRITETKENHFSAVHKDGMSVQMAAQCHKS